MEKQPALNDKVIIPAGTKIGMGTLKKEVEAMLVRIDTNDNGKSFYTVKWADAKTGKTRYTCLATVILANPISNPCDNLTPSDLWEGAYIPVTVTEVVLNRAEGPSRLCGIDHKFPTLDEADSVLMAWAWGMPADQMGYDKVDFTVYLSNGDTYEGRFDLKPSHRKNANIKKHMVSHLEWIAKNGDMIGAKYAEQAKQALPVYRSL